MKKILGIFLSIVLLFNCAVTASASMVPYTGSGEAEITAHLYGSYYITIPATLDANSGMGDVTISQATIEEGYKVDVYVTNANNDGSITLTHTNGINEIECIFYNITLNETVSDTVPLVTFYATEFTDTSAATKNFRMDLMALSIPGYYSGTMTYSFSYNPCE